MRPDLDWGDVVVFAGVALLVTGAALISLPLAFGTAGTALIITGLIMARGG